MQKQEGTNSRQKGRIQCDLMDWDGKKGWLDAEPVECMRTAQGDLAGLLVTALASSERMHKPWAAWLLVLGHTSCRCILSRGSKCAAGILVPAAVAVLVCCGTTSESNTLTLTGRAPS
jgi:hypothetical protein